MSQRPTPRPITRLLIANRGEIAVRIIRSCRELGIQAIAVYSDADASALHVRLADEAYRIGPAPAVHSYLCVDALLAAARAARADAVHPGYGFLAENAAFARAVVAAGLIWVGPPPEVIAALGDKTTARTLARRSRVPIVPGTKGTLATIETAARAATRIGYPVLLKAVAGGGGKGMRIVHTAAELAASFTMAQSEAQNAFGNGALYLEKYLVSPHHIEVQILADQYGHVLHCGERECSLQRRHQKLIEETPSPFISDPTRKKICQAALRLMKAAGYVNAGTVEFLVDAEQRFYFLEVNTRIQVEHPITELVTGLDLVAQQLRIAAGEPLTLTQREVQARGHALECRLYAEDPMQQFFPSPGLITSLSEPLGNGIRMDSGIYAGYVVPIDYDPILGKLCTWGATRTEAIARMARALREYRIGGITTNLFLHHQILQHAAFRAGQYDTTFIAQQHQALLHVSAASIHDALVAAAVARSLIEDRPTHTAPAEHPTWKRAARYQGVRSGMEPF